MSIEYELNLARSTETILVCLNGRTGSLSYTHLEYQENDPMQFAALLTVRMGSLFKELGLDDD